LNVVFGHFIHSLSYNLLDNSLVYLPSKSELRTTHTAIALPEFLSSKASIYDPGWLPARIVSYVVGKPLWWALEQMGIIGEEGLLGSSSRGHHHKDSSWWGAYVLVHLVEAAADDVLERQNELQVTAGDALYTLDSFRSTFGGVGAGGASEALRELDAQVLIKYLERDRGVLVVDKEVCRAAFV
jgi:charged multivesicular body protein 7